MARCDRCDAQESMWVVRVCPHCGYPGQDTRTPERQAWDAADCHERMWGWDHEYLPDAGGNCRVCRADG